MNTFLFVADGAFYGSIGLVFVTFGILVSIRFLGYPDLTPDGSFTLGACAYAKMLSQGQPEALAVVAGLGLGALAGCMTATLNEFLRIGKLLSSVIMMVIGIALAPYILGKATIGLLKADAVLVELSAWDQYLTDKIFGSEMNFRLHIASVIAGLAVAGITAVGLRFLATTRHGVGVRYLGSSFSAESVAGGLRRRYKYLALCMANALVAAGGMVEACRRGGADQGMGLGIVLIGISALIIGESVLRTAGRVDILGPTAEVVAAVVGTIVYALIVQIVLEIEHVELDVRILTAILLAMILGISHRERGRVSELF